MQSETSMIKLDINLIIPNQYQPRKVFDENSLNSLSDSIKKYGIINPILVRKKDDKYEIIAGERRFRAAKQLGLTEVPVIIKTADEQQMAELALIENIQRQDLSAIEEAKSYEEIMRLGNQTQSSLAEKIGKSQSFIANKIRLLALPTEIQEALAKKQISERHARSLLNVEDKERQLELLDRIITEKLTVKETEATINEKAITENEIKQAISDIMKSLNIEEDEDNKEIEEDKKEEKEDDNMNNGNFFPSFDNNNVANNNASLNMMNMQSMNQMPVAPEPEMVMPTPVDNGPIMNQPPQMAPATQDPTQIPTFTPFGMDSMANNIVNQPISEPIINPPLPPMSEVMPTEPNQPVLSPQIHNQEASTIPMMDIPLFNPEATMPPVELTPVQDPIIPSQTPAVELQGPVMEEPQNLENTMLPPTTDKLEQLKNILNANGYSYKVYSNETDNCIIIELPKN